MVFSWALAIPIGTIVALRRGSVTDRALSFLSFLGMSVPSFFLAFLLMIVLFARLQELVLSLGPIR